MLGDKILLVFARSRLPFNIFGLIYFMFAMVDVRFMIVGEIGKGPSFYVPFYITHILLILESVTQALQGLYEEIVVLFYYKNLEQLQEAGEGPCYPKPLTKCQGRCDLGNLLPSVVLISFRNSKVRNCVFLRESSSMDLNLMELGILWIGDCYRV